MGRVGNVLYILKGDFLPFCEEITDRLKKKTFAKTNIPFLKKYFYIKP